VKNDYDGPKMEVHEDGKYVMTPTFIQEMISWFKDGKTLPNRYVWEIILGAHAHFVQEETMVKLDIDDGMTCDVIGLYLFTSFTFHMLICVCKVTPTVGADSIDPMSGNADLSLGQFYDLLHLFSLTGEPSEKHCLLMNGDLVDRGSWSVEVILMAFAYKCESFRMRKERSLTDSHERA
jgi:serine/threonine-protein phosphatase 5